MNARLIIVVKPRGSKTDELALYSGPEVPPGEQEQKFMKFRIDRTSTDFEEAWLCRLEVDRHERLDLPKGEAPAVKPAKHHPKNK